MKRKLQVLLFLFLCCSAAYSQHINEAKVRAAVQLHQTTYPELQLKDLYKAFFQAEFGAEHIVSDSTAAGRYLNRELEIPDRGHLLFEPIGADSTFFRVHLNAVQKGLITRQLLFHAFLAGVHKVEIPQIKSWQHTWREIETVILSMDLNLPHLQEDRTAIHELLESGEYASHHSQAFEKAYDPHYRIIRKDAFYRELYPYLSEAGTKLKTGDLVFVSEGNSPFSHAIAAATSDAVSSYTHVGIICCKEDGSTVVLEATSEHGVTETPLDSFRQGQQLSFYRVIAKDFDAKAAIERAHGFMGQPYDFLYLPDNNQMYCSELVYECYRKADGSPLFEAKPMNFRDKDGNMPQFWTDLFAKHNMDIPEGVLGTNPNDMAKSKCLVKLQLP